MSTCGRKNLSIEDFCAGLNGTASGRAFSRWAVMYPATRPETSAICSGLNSGEGIDCSCAALCPLLRLPEPLPLLGDKAVNRVHILDIA